MAENRGKSVLDEFGLIDRYFRPLATDAHAFGLADDAAVLLQEPGSDVVLSSDMVCAGIHFFPDDPPSAIARKALRVNVSDIVAKGARPFAYTLSIALPEGTTGAWLAGFTGGLRGDQDQYGLTLLGGDTTRSAGGLAVSITAFGRVDAGGMVRRAGGSPGDGIYVSGTIGDSAIGLMVRQGEVEAADIGRGAGSLEARYLVPDPPAALVPALRDNASAALDVSDGLWADLGHMCSASGVTADVDAGRVPLSDAVQRLVARRPEMLMKALTGGDDYQVLAAIPPERSEGFENAAASAGVQVSRIGTLVAGQGAPTMTLHGEALSPVGALGHTHF